MVEVASPSRKTKRPALLWTALVGVLTTLVALYAFRGRLEVPLAEPAPAVEMPPADEALVLPHDPPDLPPGPHRIAFETSCTICHSTRLVVNQPPFPQKKWAEEVHKMVTAYGAPIAPEDEPRIVEYLMVLRGRAE